MSEHQFKCGADVRLTREFAFIRQSNTVYSVVACLPSEGTVPRYRIKAAHEAFSRVALEDTMIAVHEPEPSAAVLVFPERSIAIAAGRGDAAIAGTIRRQNAGLR